MNQDQVNSAPEDSPAKTNIKFRELLPVCLFAFLLLFAIVATSVFLVQRVGKIALAKRVAPEKKAFWDESPFPAFFQKVKAKYEDKGYKVVESDAVEITASVPQKTLFLCDQFSLNVDTQADIVVLSRNAVLKRKLKGNLVFAGQKLIVASQGSVEGEVESLSANTIVIQGKINGKLFGNFRRLNGEGYLNSTQLRRQYRDGELPTDKWWKAKKKSNPKAKQPANAESDNKKNQARTSKFKFSAPIRKIVDRMMRPRERQRQIGLIELARVTPNKKDRVGVVQVLNAFLNQTESNRSEIARAMKNWETRELAAAIRERVRATADPENTHLVRLLGDWQDQSNLLSILPNGSREVSLAALDELKKLGLDSAALINRLGNKLETKDGTEIGLAIELLASLRDGANARLDGDTARSLIACLGKPAVNKKQLTDFLERHVAKRDIPYLMQIPTQALPSSYKIRLLLKTDCREAYQLIARLLIEDRVERYDFSAFQRRQVETQLLERLDSPEPPEKSLLLALQRYGGQRTIVQLQEAAKNPFASQEQLQSTVKHIQNRLGQPD